MMERASFSLDSTTKDGRDALIIAIQSGSIECTEILVEAGMRINTAHLNAAKESGSASMWGKVKTLFEKSKD